MKHIFDLAQFCYTSFNAQSIYILHDMISQTAFDFDYMIYLVCLIGEILSEETPKNSCSIAVMKLTHDLF